MLSRIAATACLLLAALTSSAVGQPITLDVTYSSGAYSDMLAASAREFEKAHPDIRIRYRSPVMNSYDELLQATLRAATIGDLPDLSLEGNQNVAILAARGIPIALDSLIAGEPTWRQQGRLPAIRDVGRLGDRTYALAYATSVPVIYVNVDLLKQAGVADLAGLKDWNELTASAAKVQQLGGGIIGGAFDYNATGNWTFQALVTSQGGQFLTADGSDIAFDNAEGQRALQILKAFGAAGAVDMTQTQMLQAFASGTVGIFASYSAAIGQIEKGIGGRFEMRTVPWPILAPDGRIPAGGRTVMIYAKDPVRQKAAWEYAKFLTGPLGQTILVRDVGAVPVNDLAVTDPNLLGPFYEAHPNQRAALEAVPRLTKWVTYPGSNSVKASEIVRDHLRRVLILQDDPSVVMADMVEEIRPLLTK